MNWDHEDHDRNQSLDHAYRQHLTSGDLALLAESPPDARSRPRWLRPRWNRSCSRRTTRSTRRTLRHRS